MRRLSFVSLLGSLLLIALAARGASDEDEKKDEKDRGAGVEDVANAAAGAAVVGSEYAAAQAAEAPHARRSTYAVLSSALALTFPVSEHPEFDFSPGVAVDGLAAFGDQLRVGGTMALGLFGLNPDAYGERFRPASGESTEAFNFRIGPRVELALTKGPFVPFVSLAGTFTWYTVRLTRECVDDPGTPADDCADQKDEEKDSVNYTALSLAPGAGIAYDVGASPAAQRLFLRADYIWNGWLSGPSSDGLELNHFAVLAGMSFGFI